MMIAPMMVMAAAAQLAPADRHDTIAAALADSAAGWNSGDLSRFTSVYAEDAVFAGSKGLLRGRPAIAAHFAASFRTGGNARGTLTFQPLLERAIDPTHRLYVARWMLSGPKPRSGLTTLLFEKQGGRWRIISDHSS
ncbi:hypothetical protein GCM10011380_23410 [Sphingomonas metalli]|uniref:DUF4440 domain-containing protein n=1 Tax=Sphingomonas metalli TaxID=1779358 RepID=A0A916WTM8_9SPHN|nr:SgcJ/EcaC family oxidoreductase [Sphingomonas metalli]GGB33273.1 hypothetical protein GCM10011380_23410 [Sphingomonas metalli]